MKITYQIFTSQGDRQINEDFTKYAKYQEKELFLLADGLGGHGRGDEASKYILNHIAAAFQEGNTDLPSCIMESQEGLLKEQKRQEALDSMKTTLTALLIENQTATMYHVGDSRIYCFQGKKLKTRTLDHSIPQMLCASGEIKESEIRHHQDRNRLFRVMGVDWDEPKYQVTGPVPLKGKESFLLCSDGFWEWIEEKQMMKRLVKAKSVEEWVQQMAEDVLEQGHALGQSNMDNYSAVGVFVRKN